MGYGRFGVREICDVVFRPLSSLDIGNQHFDRMQPCLYLDTAQTSSLEGAATTVYAQGGRGNSRLIAWEGEKTLTLTITDALMSTISFAMLSGAGVVEAYEEHTGVGKDPHGKRQAIYMHTTYEVPVESYNGAFYAILDEETLGGDTVFVSKEAPVYGVVLNGAGGVKSYLSAIKLEEMFKLDSDGVPQRKTSEDDTTVVNIFADGENGAITFENIPETQSVGIAFLLKDEKTDSNYQGEKHAPMLVAGDIVRIDCYTIHTAGATQINIDADNFAGYYYIEADTLFRDEATGKDFPAEFVIPRGKIQSNFTFTMASTGDPSTFDFTIDCFPAYTSFSKNKKVLAQLNVVDPTVESHNYVNKNIHGHEGRDADHNIDKFWGPSMFETASTNE